MKTQQAQEVFVTFLKGPPQFGRDEKEPPLPLYHQPVSDGWVLIAFGSRPSGPLEHASNIEGTQTQSGYTILTNIELEKGW